MTAAHARSLLCRSAKCRYGTPGQAAHHDRLLLVDVDPDQLLELIEMAVTWHELDYSQCEVLGPRDWLTFAQQHEWTCPERAEMAFSLALDIVRRSAPDPARPAPVIELVRS